MEQDQIAKRKIKVIDSLQSTYEEFEKEVNDFLNSVKLYEVRNIQFLSQTWDGEEYIVALIDYISSQNEESNKLTTTEE